MNQRERDIKKVIISTFKWIRDMPFEIKLDKKGYYEDLTYIRTYERGSCSPKHYLLGSICKELELQVVYLTYPFYWDELGVDYPDFLKRLAEEMPLTYHLAIEVCIGKEKFLLDATWDSPLGKAGFPINKIGDKLTNTKIAIVPSGKPVIHTSALERDEWIQSLKVNVTNAESKFEFYIALNAWLEQIRKA